MITEPEQPVTETNAAPRVISATKEPELPVAMGKRRRFVSLFSYVSLVVAVGAVTASVALLWQNIADRKREALQHAFRVVELHNDLLDPAEWGKNYPRQYELYMRTQESTQATKYGGSVPYQKMDKYPVWRTLFKGYAFAVDYKEERGHYYMLSDQDETLRVTARTPEGELKFKQPGSCLHCHSSNSKAYRDEGRKAGVSDDKPREQLMKGFEIVCAMSIQDARKLVSHPVTCVDCHEPQSMQLRVSRPGFLNGIAEFAKRETKDDEDYPHLPSVASWRKGARDKDYDPNTMASRQEMRSFVCGQCHVEYYFHGKGKLLTYPWHKGLKVQQMEDYYDNQVGHIDWTHPDTGTPMLKAQHPEFETWNQGIHARSGVACADCHMPYKREGAIKISDHHVRSPLLNIARACQTCHHYPESELKARAEAIQDRCVDLEHRAEEALFGLVQLLKQAKDGGAKPEDLKPAQMLHRKAQWRLDMVNAENSRGFHAPHETYRVLGESVDYARQGQVEATKVVLRVVGRIEALKAMPKEGERAGTE
jgi:nitrite reductase (cytochrome c-552)